MHPIDLALQLWAKSRADGTYHPLICHMLDVAAVTEQLCHSARCSPIVAQIAEGFRLEAEEAIPWVVFFAALHDLGKAYPHFQFLEAAPNALKKSLQEAGLGINRHSKVTRHGMVTAAILRDTVQNVRLLPEGHTVWRLARVLGGHHGIFPMSRSVREARRQVRQAEPKYSAETPTWADLRGRVTELLAEILLSGSNKSPVLKEDDNSTPVLLAGLISVADWIGSSEEYFPYQPRRLDPRSYWSHSRANAHNALVDLGWTGWNLPEKKRTFLQLFPAIKEPRPLQTQIIHIVESTPEAQLILIEAPMGEGKTEAALYLQDCWSRQRLQPGAYFALPTMAASNQLFARTLEFLQRRYTGQRLNVLLLHSHKLLNDDYEHLRASAIDQDDQDEPSELAADEWFTKPKRGLLAPFAVGTVDQSLLSVLQVRHGFVRLFGLAGKTVIFDEVHAYDTYMLTLFERLLEWLAALHTTVVILSATLPSVVRRGLLKAYVGREIEFKDELYPRVTCLSADGTVQVDYVPASSERYSVICLKWIENDVVTATQHLYRMLVDGGCIVWICNTVNRAQDVYTKLKDELRGTDVELELFHARFPLGQRVEIENRVLEKYGKEDAHRPRKSILVATQVVEQSLDLDFDLMLSELAPVDLILQRTGRMHRHKNRKRPSEAESPVLYVFKPNGHNESRPQLGKTVYDEYILLRSWFVLRDKSQISIPGDVESLIESVYGEEPLDTPTCFAARISEAKERHEEARLRAAFQGRMVEVAPPCGDDVLEKWNAQLDEDDPDKNEILQARTRLSPPSVTIVCLKHESEIELQKAGPERMRKVKELVQASVSLSYRGCSQDFPRDMVPKGWREVGLLRHCRAVVFQDGVFDGDIMRIRLDDELGIVLKRKSKEGKTDADIVQSDL